MAFQIKDFKSIAASMINYAKAATKKITDYTVGSVTRTWLEASAIEIDELYQQMFLGLQEAIPVSVYSSFSFGLLPAVSAGGTQQFTLAGAQTVNVTIPAGSRVGVPGSGVVYATAQDLVITAGNTIGTVAVAATTPGAAGNTPAGSVTLLVDQVPLVASTTNLTVFSNGADEETDDQRKIRFQGYIATLQHGTIAALRYGASLATVLDVNGQVIERVVAVNVVEPYLTDPSQPIALVNVYVHNGTGGTSSNLVTATKTILYGYYDANGNAVPGWQAAGVQVNVYAATELAVAVTANITVAAGYSATAVKVACVQAVTAYLQGLGIGVSAIWAEIITTIMNVPGVTNVTLTTPTADVAATAGQKIMPGTITAP